MSSFLHKWFWYMVEVGRDWKLVLFWMQFWMCLFLGRDKM